MSRRGQLGSVSSTSVVSSAPSDADALLDALVGAAQQQHKARRLSRGKGKAEGNHHHNNKNSRRSSRHSLPFIKADLRPGASEGGEQLPRVRPWGVQRGAGGERETRDKGGRMDRQTERKKTTSTAGVSPSSFFFLSPHLPATHHTPLLCREGCSSRFLFSARASDCVTALALSPVFLLPLCRFFFSCPFVPLLLC